MTNRIPFNERKLMLQVSINPVVSAVAAKSKRARALIARCEAKGWIVYEGGCIEFTEEGLAILEQIKGS